jgi:hypothetical protein
MERRMIAHLAPRGSHWAAAEVWWRDPTTPL